MTNFACTFCGEAGSPHYYAARVLSICLGCLAPMIIGNLILPWRARLPLIPVCGMLTRACRFCSLLAQLLQSHAQGLPGRLHACLHVAPSEGPK